jgi:hypothetical protein
MNDCSLRIFLSNNVWADFAEFILMFAYFLLVKLLCLLGVDTVLSACYGMVVVQEFRAPRNTLISKFTSQFFFNAGHSNEVVA